MRPLPKERRCHPRQQDSPPVPRPLPTRPVPTRALAGCVSCLRLCALPRKNLLFFTSSRVRQYPTVTATSRGGSSASFVRDIGYAIIDASLVRRCVATRGRGCIPQRVDLRQNKSTRGHNAQAFAVGSPLQQRAYACAGASAFVGRRDNQPAKGSTAGDETRVR